MIAQLIHKFLTISILIFLFACARPEEPLRIGTNIWIGYAPLYLARDLGYFEKTPVKLAEYNSATDVIHAFRNGNLEAAALTLDEVLLLLNEGYDTTVILVMDYSKGADAIVSRPDIKEMEGLKGKRIGMESMAVGAYVLSRALEVAGLDPSDVTIVPMNIDEHESAFREKKVDAVVTFDPVLTRLTNAGAVTIFDSSMIPGEILDVLIMRTDVLLNRPESARRLVSDWFRAVDYIKSNPEDASARMGKWLRLSGQDVGKSLQGLHFPDITDNAALLGPNSAEILKPARKLTTVMSEKGFLSGPLDPAALIDERALKEKKP